MTGTQAPINFTIDMINEDTITDFANTLDQNNFAALLRYLAGYYHNEAGLVSDKTYDELMDIYEAKFGPYEIVGAEPTGEKVNLPYYLGSLRKIKKDKELQTWLEGHPGPYIIEDKIDGLTLLLVSSIVQGRRINKLYTRGAGYRGMDVSHLLDYLRLPPINQDIAIRGEIVMTKDAFARVGAGFKNARNMVSGLLNAKKQFNPVLARELSFFPYRIINNTMTPEEEIAMLQTIGFVVPNPVFAQNLTREILENYFQQRKITAPYEIDGLVIYQNVIEEYPVGEAPRHVIAFKTDTERATTTVKGVTWEASKDRLLKPVIHYEPITLSGAVLQKASGYNARFIVTNNIGPGAQILVTRSGDVIPKVIAVLTPAPGGPDYPQNRKFTWNENQVEFVLLEDDDEVITNKLRHFLETLGVKHAGPARVRAMVDAGIKSVSHLLAVTPLQLSGIPGIGGTLSNQLVDDIHERITNVSLARIMDASGIFSRIGERRFEAILEVHPNILEIAATNDKITVANYIRGVRGFNTLSDEIADNLPVFIEWLKQHPQITIEAPTPLVAQIQGLTLDATIQPRVQVINKPTILPITQPFPQTINQPQVPVVTIPQTQVPVITIPQTQVPVITIPQTIVLPITHPAQQIALPITRPTQPTVQPAQVRNLAGITVVFSGFSRQANEDFERRIKTRGGKVTGAVSRNTTFLIMKDVNDIKGKGQKAQELGVRIISKDDFEAQYLR
ncbi:NAD-dependent DNA ligase [uncultured virus]|nr:NAD-dependent DNA ligase [uncultured virus]